MCGRWGREGKEESDESFSFEISLLSDDVPTSHLQLFSQRFSNIAG